MTTSSELNLIRTENDTTPYVIDCPLGFLAVTYKDDMVSPEIAEPVLLGVISALQSYPKSKRAMYSQFSPIVFLRDPKITEAGKDSGFIKARIYGKWDLRPKENSFKLQRVEVISSIRTIQAVMKEMALDTSEGEFILTSDFVKEALRKDTMSTSSSQ